MLQKLDLGLVLKSYWGKIDLWSNLGYIVFKLRESYKKQYEIILEKSIRYLLKIKKFEPSCWVYTIHMNSQMYYIKKENFENSFIDSLKN